MRKLGKDALANLKLDTSCQIDLGSSVTAVDSSNYKTNIVWGFNHDNPIQDDDTFRQQKSIVLDATTEGKGSGSGKFIIDYSTIKSDEVIVPNVLSDGTKNLNITTVNSLLATWKNDKEYRAKIKNIYIPYGVISLQQFSLAGTGIEEIDLPETVKNIFMYSLAYTSLKFFQGGNTITTISGNAFSGSALKECDISATSVTTLAGAFSGCTKLTNIKLPNVLETIGVSCFSGCTALTDVTIPTSVTSIDSTAFANCLSLKTITIKKSTDSIKNAPWGATNVEQVIWEE